LATGQVWQRLAAHSSTPEVAAKVSELKTLLDSENFSDSWSGIAECTNAVLSAYKQAYSDLFKRRQDAYESAIGEIKNRAEWGALRATNEGLAVSLLSSLQGRVGRTEEMEAVSDGTSLGEASLTEMESDLCAVDGLKSSVLVKLQEMSLGGEKKAPVRRVRASEFFNRPIQTQEELEQALTLIRESLQKYIDEGAVIILE
jgi:hypothetical protein